MHHSMCVRFDLCFSLKYNITSLKVNFLKSIRDILVEYKVVALSSKSIQISRMHVAEFVQSFSSIEKLGGDLKERMLTYYLILVKKSFAQVGRHACREELATKPTF